jgi:diguanylate cyclase (GGDEF)-like protein
MCTVTSAAQRKGKVLILHSYHQGLEWSDNISKGIQDAFSSHLSEYELYYEYLDSKRNVGDEYLTRAASFINTKSSKQPYELVIAVDNNALSLLNRHAVQLLDNPPVVFCGINNFNPSLVNNINQVTGVAETTDHIGTLDLINRLHPNRKKVTVILDETPTGLNIREEFKAVEKHYAGVLEFQFLSQFLLKDIPTIVQKLNDDDVIYILTFNRDKEDNFISYSEGINIITLNSTVPVYGSWGFYLNKGIIGGKITSGYMQGEIAGEMAVAILKGRKANEIDVILDSPSQYKFDFNYLEKYHINEETLPFDREIINKPLTFFEKNQSILLDIFISLFILVLIGLYFSIMKQTIAQKKYAQKLELKVKKRTESLSKANKKLELLSNIDGLSQIYNRRYFDQVLRREVLSHCRAQVPLSLIIIDIDYFKKYNDCYGHLSGDDCIREVSSLLNNICKRDIDTVARYGGEEFTVILPQTDAHTANVMGEKIRLAIIEKNIPHRDSLVSDVVTVSIGITTIIPTPTTTIESIILNADGALYESKNGGRNKVTFCDRL